MGHLEITSSPSPPTTCAKEMLFTHREGKCFEETDWVDHRGTVRPRLIMSAMLHVAYIYIPYRYIEVEPVEVDVITSGQT